MRITRTILGLVASAMLIYASVSILVASSRGYVMTYAELLLLVSGGLFALASLMRGED